MRILYLLPKLVNSGPSNVVATLISHEAMRAHEVTVATFLGKDDSHERLLSEQHINYLSLDGVNFPAIKQLATFIRAQNIDVVHSHGLIPDIVSALIALWTPSLRITTIHCDIKKDYAMEYPWLKAKIYTWLHFLALRIMPNRAVVSESVQSKLPFSSHVVRNGVPQQNAAKMLTEYRQHTDSTGLTLVFAGRLIKRKNVQFLIDCVTRFNEEHQQVLTLNIYGEGELESTLRELTLKSKQSTHIHFLGFHDNFANNLPNNAVFVNPSLAEGLPMAVIELLARGVPCILSNIKPHQEIANGMKAGVALFDFDYDSFVNAVKQLTTPKLTLNINSSALETSFASNLSDHQMVDSYLALYQGDSETHIEMHSSAYLSTQVQPPENIKSRD